MVAVIGLLLDHGGDAGQGQVVGVEAAGAGSLAQRGIQVVEWLVVKARVGPGSAHGWPAPPAHPLASERASG